MVKKERKKENGCVGYPIYLCDVVHSFRGQWSWSYSLCGNVTLPCPPGLLYLIYCLKHWLCFVKRYGSGYIGHCVKYAHLLIYKKYRNHMLIFLTFNFINTFSSLRYFQWFAHMDTNFYTLLCYFRYHIYQVNMQWLNVKTT